jgi:hypothetical protein
MAVITIVRRARAPANRATPSSCCGGLRIAFHAIVGKICDDPPGPPRCGPEILRQVPARVAAVCYFRVLDPQAAVTQIEAFGPPTSQIAQTTLRWVLGGADLDQLLAERERLNDQLQRIIDEQTEPGGIKVSIVEIKDVEIPEAMERAMARQAESERERRAKIISAEGEFQAAEKLAKPMVVVVIGVLIAFHMAAPESRTVAIAVFVASLAALWLGVELAH